MNNILSGSWLFKRKKEPEPLKEEEVVDIIQQALENPSANTTITNRKTNSGDGRRSSSKHQTPTSSMVQDSEPVTEHNNEVDPKVVEYFRDFPQPYRDKAIQRFSKRDGVYRFDVFRDYAMQHEWSSAVNRNVFLEDQREQREHEAKKQAEKWEKNFQEHLQKRRDGDIPEWESKLMKYIPVDDDESAGWKLVNVSNLVLLSGLLLYQGVKYRKVSPNIASWSVYRDMALRFGAAGLAGTGAVYRLMNWGPFDRSKDGRDIFTRMLDDCNKDLEKLKNYLDGKNK